MNKDSVIPAGRTGFRVRIWVARSEANMLLGVLDLCGLSRLDKLPLRPACPLDIGGFGRLIAAMRQFTPNRAERTRASLWGQIYRFWCDNWEVSTHSLSCSTSVDF